MIYIAALDSDGVIVSIVSLDEAWCGTCDLASRVRALQAKGFTYYPLDSVGPKEVERYISGQVEFDEWVATLQPA